MSLEPVYEPIRGDLEQVEARLRALTDVRPEWLAELLRQSLLAGGKRLRPALVLLSGSFCRYDPGILLPMATAIEVLHTATLVHDDAIDHSAMRRGRPTTYSLWGETRAILLGDYLLAQAEELTSETENNRVVRLLARALKSLAAGELGQATNAFNMAQTREQYFTRIAAKTASLTTLATESGAVLSGAPEAAVTALRDYGHNLGVAFQVVDDILDFVGDEAEMGKPTGADFSEGTLTLPMMLFLERHPEDNPLARLFRQEGDKKDNLRQAVALVLASGVIVDSYEVATDYAGRALASLSPLPDSPARRALEELARFVVARRR